MSTRDSELDAFFEDLALTFDISVIESGMERLGRDTVRAAIVSRLESGEIERIPLFLLVYLLEAAGVGELWDPFAAYVCNRQRPRTLRALLAFQLSNHDVEGWHRVAEALVEEDLTLALEGHLDGAFQLARLGPAGPNDRDFRESIASMLEKVPEEALPLLAPRLESLRERSGLAPSEIWPFLLARPGLSALFPTCIDALVKEASDTAVDALERLRRETSDDALRKLAQAACLKARSRSIDPDLPPPTLAPATAQVTECSGDGAFLLRVRIDRRNGLFDGLTMFVENHGLTTRGLVVTQQRPESLDGPFIELNVGSHYRFIDAPLPEVVRLLANVVDRQELGFREKRALELLEQYKALPVSSALPAPAENATPEAYARLLKEHPIYASWDLAEQAVGILQALSDQTGEDKVRSFLLILFVQLRMSCTVNAHWHHWNGEEREAALMLRAAQDLAAVDSSAPFPSYVIRTFRESARQLRSV